MSSKRSLQISENHEMQSTQSNPKPHWRPTQFLNRAQLSRFFGCHK